MVFCGLGTTGLMHSMHCIGGRMGLLLRTLEPVQRLQLWGDIAGP